MSFSIVAMALATSAAAASLTLASCGESQTNGTAAKSAEPASATSAQDVANERPQGVVADCSTRSQAGFPCAFTDSHNVVVGPLVLVGAGYTAPSTVRRFGGNKFPALVSAGHRVTVAVARRAQRAASLGYGPLPEGVKLAPRQGHPVVTFIACGPRTESGSDVDGHAVTFWSGSVLTNSPRCVPLEVWVDDEPAPRRTALRMGVRRCP